MFNLDHICVNYEFIWYNTIERTTMQVFKEKVITPIFFGLFLIMGLFIFQDYGISWDEEIQRKHGLITVDYVNEVFGKPFYSNKLVPEHSLHTYDFRFHGTFFQNTCFLFEKVLGIKDIKGAYLLRHLGVFLIFWMACFAFYKLLRLRFKEWWLALIGVTILVLTPRIFAHSFYNPKDLPFLSFFIMSIWALFMFLDKRNMRWAVILALLSAVLMNARVLGVLVPIITLIIMCFEWIRAKNRLATS